MVVARHESGGGRVHPGWTAFVDGLARSGVAPDLGAASVPDRVGRGRASRPPEPHARTALLESYFGGEGRPGQALARVRAARLVEHRESRPSTAREIVGRLRLASPELEGLALVDDETSACLVLRTKGARAAIDDAAVGAEQVLARGVVFVRRTVTVRALVAAVNALLAARGSARRFVPLATCDGVEAYVSVRPSRAMVLDAAGALDEPLDDLCDLTRWSADELAAVVDRLRSVA